MFNLEQVKNKEPNDIYNKTIKGVITEAFLFQCHQTLSDSYSRSGQTLGISGPVGMSESA